MRMMGGARNGYCSKLSPVSVYAPSRDVRIAMTIATIGRRMKNSATLGSRLRGGLADRLHLHARPHSLHPFHDHPLARLEPVAHDVEGADPLLHLDRPERDLV